MSTSTEMTIGSVRSSGSEPSSYGWWMPFAILVPIIVVVLVVVAVRRRFSGLPQKRIGGRLSSLAVEEKDSGSQESITCTQCEWPSPIMTGAGVSQEWSEFVTERLEELKPRQDGDESKWALGIVDFLDELKESDAEASPAERDVSTSLQHELLTVLSSRGFETIDSESWNSGLQRAVAVVRKPDVIKTTILKKGSTGLSRNGKIIRKQEVKIEMKGN